MKFFSRKLCAFLSAILFVCSCFNMSMNVSAAVFDVCGEVEESTVTRNVQSVELLSPTQLRTNGFQGRYVHSATDELAANSNDAVRAIPGQSSYIAILDVPVETQINSYYCGPATVIQNLSYWVRAPICLQTINSFIW